MALPPLPWDFWVHERENNKKKTILNFQFPGFEILTRVQIGEDTYDGAAACKSDFSRSTHSIEKIPL